MFRIGRMCEPTRDADLVTVADASMRAIRTTAGLNDPYEQDALKESACRPFPVRTGNMLAGSRRFPRRRAFGALFLYWLHQRLQQIARGRQTVRSENFSQLLSNSACNETGLGYKLPDPIRTSQSGTG